MTLCVTYYQEWYGMKIYDVQIHKTGVAACKYLEETAQSAFSVPINKKSNYRITKRSSVSIGYGHRGYIGRQLDEQEIADYKKYGEDNMSFSPTDGRLHERSEAERLVEEWNKNNE